MSALLLDAMKKEFGLDSDAAIGRFVGDSRQLINTVRHGKRPPDSLILKIHKSTKWPVSAIEALIGTKEAA